MTTLLLTGRFGRDDQALWHAALHRGWQCERLRGARIPEIDDSEIVVYAEAFYAPLIEQRLGITLLEPPEDWLVQLPGRYLNRAIRMASLCEARALRQRTFIKPPNDKSFKAKVYSSGDELPAEFDPNMNVLLAEPVEWQDEYRCFLLDGKVRAVSVYSRSGVLAELDGFRAGDREIADAVVFAEQVASDAEVSLPRAIALDVGMIYHQGWSVVEANGAWGSGIYGCDPDEVLEVIRHAIATTKKSPA
jgi:ATP-grasp domain, R2K clade family 2